jgi:hypothetical protein
LKSEINYPNTEINFHFPEINCAHRRYRSVFNKVAESIIASDIAVFEISNKNPNVMIDLGIALTFGKNVLLIRERTSDKPPSDISGHTYAEYDNDVLNFKDNTHDEQLLNMLKNSIIGKRNYINSITNIYKD